MLQRNSSRHHPAARAHADHGTGLSARHDRDCRRHLPETGRGQPDREGRQGGRLRPDRAGVQGRQIFPRPSVGDLGARSERFDQDGVRALQRGQFRRLQPRPDQQGAERPGQGRRREAEGGKSVACRCRSISSRPRPAGSIRTSRRRRALFQVPRVAKARNLPDEIASASSSPTTPRAVSAACSASPALTFWR